MAINNSKYHYIACKRRKLIIDFEYMSSYPLASNNIDYSCVPLSNFVSVVRGDGMFPTQNMKKKSKINDWGNEDATDQISHLFKSTDGKY